MQPRTGVGMSIQTEISNAGNHVAAPPQSDESLRQLVEKMQERERRLMVLLNTSAPERIEHDLRNVLNELVLLRTLFDPKSGD